LQTRTTQSWWKNLFHHSNNVRHRANSWFRLATGAKMTSLTL
jgi:hypothetical protein